MKLDKLFEKFLSLFKKETSELEDSDSTSLRRSRSDRKKLAQVVQFENSGVAIIYKDCPYTRFECRLASWNLFVCCGQVNQCQ